MKNMNEVREAMLRGNLKKMERNLADVMKSLNNCEKTLDEIIKDIKDVNDEELVETIRFALKTINLGKKNKSSLEANIAYINNELQSETKVQELLREKLELSKKEEARLREQFYSGEYDSKLVNDMNEISKQIKNLELLINNETPSVDGDFEGDILSVHKMKCDKASTDKENDEGMIITLPISGITVDLNKIDTDGLEKNLNDLNKLTQQILSSKCNKDIDVWDEFMKVFGDRINIVSLNNDESIDNDIKRSIFTEPLRQHLYSTKHLLDENGKCFVDDKDKAKKVYDTILKSMGVNPVEENKVDDECKRFMDVFNIDELDHQYGRSGTELGEKLLLNWFTDTIQKKEEQDEIRKQNPKSRVNENILNSLINDDIKKLLISYPLQDKRKRQIEDKFSQTPRMFNGYENEIGTYSRNIQAGKLNEANTKKSADELEDEIMKKVMEKVPGMLAEEMQKVLNKMNK